MPIDPTLWWNDGAYIYVGRMGDNKGVEHILAAWCELKTEIPDRCPDLWLVGGTPPEIEVIRKRVSEFDNLPALEAAGRIRWWGYLDDAGISTLFLKSRALIMHSSYEPGGRVVLEAMTQGVPVIATPQGFALDLVEDWRTGFIVPYGDSKLLRHRMEHFARSPFLSISLGIAARATARAALDDWNFFEAHEDVYLKALSGAWPPPADFPHTAPTVIRNPMPHGLAGRYPFPAATPVAKDAVIAASSVLNVRADDCSVEREYTSGRSLVWHVRGGGEVVVVKHAYTSIARRPLWDRAHGGPLIWLARDRRMHELSASKRPGFVPILAEDQLRGLHILPHLANSASALPLDSMRAALGPLTLLWQAPVKEDSSRLISIADKWWRNRCYAPWRIDGNEAAKFRNSSVRIAWAELKDKLDASDILIPDPMIFELEQISQICNEIAGSEDSISFICYQHGDYSKDHLRRGVMGYRLIDGERSTAGWWGRDAALLLMKNSDQLEFGWWDEALSIMCETQERLRLVLLWVIVEAANEAARRTTLWPHLPPREARRWWAAAMERLLR